MVIDSLFLNSISPFWLTTGEDGEILLSSEYFDKKDLNNQNFFSIFEITKTSFIKEFDKISSLRNKTIKVRYHRNDILFRGTVHSTDKFYIVILWPLLHDIKDIRLLNLENEMSHPACVITEVLAAKNIINKNYEKIQILQQKAMAKKAQEIQLENLNQIFSSSPSCIHVLDPSGGLEHLNKQGLNLIGAKSFESIKGLSFFDIVHPDSIEAFTEFHEKVSMGNTEYLIYKLKSLKGEERVIESYAAPHKLSGDRIGQLSISNDITERLNQEKELEEQRRLLNQSRKLASLGKVASSIGHEINNPLAIIKAFLSLIKKDLTKAGLQDLSKGKFNHINHAVDRIISIVNGLRSLSRTEKKSFKNIDLTKLLIDLCQVQNELFSKENIVIEHHIENNLEIIGDSGKIEQVIINLLSNSRDALSNDTKNTIEIKAWKENEFVIVTVRDQGSGIPKEIQEHIFDPFFSSKDLNKGTGIGLSISHEIAKDHDGNLSLLSTNENGTTFKLELKAIK